MVNCFEKRYKLSKSSGKFCESTKNMMRSKGVKKKKELAIRRPSGSSSAKALHKKATPNHDKG